MATKQTNSNFVGARDQGGDLDRAYGAHDAVVSSERSFSSCSRLMLRPWSKSIRPRNRLSVQGTLSLAVACILIGFAVLWIACVYRKLRFGGDSLTGTMRTTFSVHTMDLFVAPTIGFDLLYALIIVQLDRRELVWVNVTAVGSPGTELEFAL